MHDPRIGRFFAVDPLAPEYPHNSPYAFSENRVVDAIELEGAEMLHFTLTWDSHDSKGHLTLVKVDAFDLIPGWFVGVRINGEYVGDRLDYATAVKAAMGYAAMTRDEYLTLRGEVSEADAIARQEIRDFGAATEEIIENVILAKAGAKTGKLKPKTIPQKKSVNDIISSAKVVKAKPNAPEHFYAKSGTYKDAVEDFNSLKGISDVKPLKNSKFKGYSGKLENGTTVTVRNGSSGGTTGKNEVTLQINPTEGAKKKIRYGD